MTAALFGKMPTTRERRLISLLIRSSGFVDQIFCQWRFRECGEGQDFGLRVVHEWADLREGVGESVADLVPGSGDGSLVRLGEDGAEHRRDHVGLVLGHVSEQVAGEVHSAALMPGALEAAPQRLDQAGVLIADHQSHAGQPAPFQRGQEAAPERLVLAVADIAAEDLPREPSAAMPVATITAIDTTWPIGLRTCR